MALKNKMPPKISVIIPTHRRYDELYRCICSILDQKGDYEILLVSDGYDKKTDKIVARIRTEYANRSHKLIYRKQKNMGPAKARNEGIAYAKGEIIAFLDDDCTVDSRWIENMIVAHKRYPEILAIAGSITPLDDGLVPEFAQSLEARAILKDNSYFYPSLVNNNSYKRSVFHHSRIRFNTAFRHAAGEDVEFNYRLYSHGIKTLFFEKISIRHRYKDALMPFVSQQFCFGKERLRHMRVANDYPFDRSSKFLYIIKRIATPMFDPWLRLSCAFRLKRRYKIMYLFLGYIQQAAYWSGFLYACLKTRD